MTNVTVEEQLYSLLTTPTHLEDANKIAKVTKNKTTSACLVVVDPDGKLQAVPLVIRRSGLGWKLGDHHTPRLLDDIYPRAERKGARKLIGHLIRLVGEPSYEQEDDK